MYANEDKATKYPTFGYMLLDSLQQGDNDGDLADGDVQFQFFPRWTQIYPEYLSDPNVTICPSDAGNGLRDVNDTNCVAYSPSAQDAGLVPEGCIDGVNDSYNYVGFLFDKADDPDPTVDLGTTDIQNQWAPLGIDFTGVQTHIQGAAAFWNAQETALDLATMATNPLVAMNAFDDDQDVTPGDNPLCTVAVCGNGNSNTVFRLREGVERFLITDINNPGASAKAQSEIAVLWDALSTIVANYNHLPGGSNVLYLDGHVEFLRYPDDVFPVNPYTANFSGGFQAASGA